MRKMGQPRQGLKPWQGRFIGAAQGPTVAPVIERNTAGTSVKRMTLGASPKKFLLTCHACSVEGANILWDKQW